MDTEEQRTCLARLPGGELKVLAKKDLSAIDGLRSKPDHVVWLDIVSPTADDVALLRDEFDVHPLALEDLEKRRQRPKLDTYAEQQIIVSYETLAPKAHERVFALGEIHLFTGPRYLVSVRWQESPAIEAVRKRFRDRPDALARTPGSLLYAILDEGVDGYFPVLDSALGQDREARGPDPGRRPDRRHAAHDPGSEARAARAAAHPLPATRPGQRPAATRPATGG